MTKPFGPATFSRDGQHVATTTFEGAGRVWSVNDGTMLRQFPDSQLLAGDAFSSDGRRLVTIAENKGARIWNSRPTEPPTALDKRRSADDQIIRAGFLPGGRVITSSMEGLTVIWDAETGAEVAKLPADMRAIYLMAAPAGDWIALVSSEGLLLWDSGRPARMRTLKHDKQVLSVAWSPGGELIASGIRGQHRAHLATRQRR